MPEASPLEPEKRPAESQDEAIDFRSGVAGKRSLLVVACLLVVGIVAAVAAGERTPRSRRESPADHVSPEERQRKLREASEFGCPCGCDRSREMVAELERQGGVEARVIAEDSLETIRAREDAGYVTEAQIRHRLNLLDLEDRLGAKGEVPPPSRHMELAPWPTHGSSWLEATDRGIRVAAELVVFGDVTEIIRGHEKLQPAHFVLRLALENTADAPRTLAEPLVRARVGFPLRRWYVVGTDGRRWDGLLEAGSKQRVHAIGYLTEAVSPGSVLDATIELGSIELRTSARARARWDEGPGG